MPIDLNSVQQDLCTEQNLIHFNSAGASLMPKQVLDCQIQHLLLEASIGGYEAARKKTADIDAIYSSVAKLINCEISEVALVENATIGWFSAFYAIDFKAGDKILTAQSEYGSNYLSYLQLAREKGVVIEIIPSTSSGEVSVSALQKMLDDKVKLISITHIPTNGGLVNPIVEIGKIAAANNILYLVDACQSVGQLSVDVKEIQCDFLSATSRKYLRGPRGAGFLYVRKTIISSLNPPLIDVRSATWNTLDSYQLRHDAKRFENWENNYAALLGMGCAIDYALHIGMHNITAYNAVLAKSLRHSLTKIKGLSLWDIGREQCAIVTFSLQGIESSKVQVLLLEYNINVSCSRPTSTLIDASTRQLPDLVRASLHYFNHQAQIDLLLSALSEINDQHLKSK
ncbi:MAG: aminotransferase class V-fold PLP-dependent enzyme [Oceanospirillaceae bacterium]|nr:aminotransferase class V-fold PLP-dependent enzyme [Oceanospirillaceae bacterium]